MSRAARLKTVRSALAALESGARHGVLPFGDERIDSTLPGGGLALGRWHELGGEGLELETAAAPAAVAALIARPLARRGAVMWIFRRDDLYAPGLAGLDFPAEGMICVQVRREAEALAALEDSLAAPGVAAVIGEVETVDLVAGRRLQLACETGGALGLVLARRPYGADRRRPRDGSAAATRWRIAAAPSAPEGDEPGLGLPRWRLTLDRCRGGRTGEWIVEQADGPLPLRVVAEPGGGQLAPPERLRKIA